VLPIKCFANDFFCRLSSSAVDHAERSCPSAESVAGHLDQSRYDGHFESIWYHPHPLLRLNREGECLAARLRPGNVHSADGWEELLLPEIERHQTLNKEVVFRGDAAFANPKLYEALEERGVKTAIRVPANDNLQRKITELLTRPVAFALNTRLDFAFANKIVSGASLNQGLKRKFSFEQA
jgi:hypothetical protein